MLSQAAARAELGGAGAGKSSGFPPPRNSPRCPAPPAPSASVPPPRRRLASEADAAAAGAEVDPRRPLKVLRASEKFGMAEKLSALSMPTGPWATDEVAKAEINLWAKDRSVAGGGFSVTWGSSEKAILSGRYARGGLHTLVCHNHTELRGKCGWSLLLEECIEGWAVRNFHPHDKPETDNGHNHTLISSPVEARARSSMREIPADLVDVGKGMIKCGVPNAQVFRYLKAVAERDGDEAMFTIEDVYTACGASTGERRLDASNLREELRKRETDQGLFQRTTTDESGCLKEVFFAMKDATAIYAIAPERQVVEIDHKARLAHRLRHLLPEMRSY